MHRKPKFIRNIYLLKCNVYVHKYQFFIQVQSNFASMVRATVWWTGLDKLLNTYKYQWSRFISNYNTVLLSVTVYIVCDCFTQGLRLCGVNIKVMLYTSCIRRVS